MVAVLGCTGIYLIEEAVELAGNVLRGRQRKGRSHAERADEGVHVYLGFIGLYLKGFSC